MTYSQVFLMSLLVSLDALFVGFAIGNVQKFKISKFVISISCITILVFLGYLLALLLRKYIEVDLKYFSIIVFLIIGIKNLFEKQKSENKALSLKELILLNFTLSLDDTILAFSTAFSDTRIIIPIIICACHFILLFLGWIFSSLVSNKFRFSNIISGLALITLAILKICNVI